MYSPVRVEEGVEDESKRDAGVYQVVLWSA
jgi:hypothetical protein